MKKACGGVFWSHIVSIVAYFAPIEKPFTVALMLDVSGSTKYQMDQICQAAVTFISHLCNNDRLMAITFDGKISLLSDVADVRTLRQSKLPSRAELGVQYSLGYYPKEDSLASGERAIKVRVPYPNLGRARA